MPFGKLTSDPSSPDGDGIVLGTGLLACAAVLQAIVAAFVHSDVIKLHPSTVTEKSLKEFPARIEYAFHYQTLLALWLLFNVMTTMFKRAASGAMNPMDETTEVRVKSIKAVLTNSLESIVLSVLLQLIFVSFAAPGCVLKCIPLINIIQFFGRITHYAGYPMYRGFGFSLTLMPNLLMAGYNLYKFGAFLQLYRG